jgi:hypothetical protein
MKERSAQKHKSVARFFGAAAFLLVLTGLFAACEAGGGDAADPAPVTPPTPVTTPEQAADAAEAFGAVNTAWVIVMLAEEGAVTLPAGITVDNSTTLGRREFAGTKGVNFAACADPVSGYVITGRIVATASADSWVFSGALALSDGPGKITALSFDAFTVTFSGGIVSFSGSVTANGIALNTATLGTAINGGTAGGTTLPVGTWKSRDPDQAFKLVVYPGNVAAVYGKTDGVYTIFKVSVGGYYDAAQSLFITKDPAAYTGFMKMSGGFDSTGNTFVQSLLTRDGTRQFALKGGDPATGLGVWKGLMDQKAGPENFRYYFEWTMTLAGTPNDSSVSVVHQNISDPVNPEAEQNVSIQFTFGAWTLNADGSGTFEISDSSYPDIWLNGPYNFVRVGDYIMFGTVVSENSSASVDQLKMSIFDRQ